MPIRRRHQIVHHTLDGALRYHRVLDELEGVWTTGAKVLEVGSGAAGIARYVDHPVIGVDTSFDRTDPLAAANLERVVGSATALPLDDGAFDVVMSLEMLEHLSAADRHAALAEMVRVLAPGGRLVLTFPSGAEAQQLDRWLNNAFRERHGIDHPWVIEHLEHGVPDAERVAGEIRSLGLTVAVSWHLSARAFRLVHGLYSVGWGGLPARLLGVRTRVVAGALFAWLRHDRNPRYRAVLVADKPTSPPAHDERPSHPPVGG